MADAQVKLEINIDDKQANKSLGGMQKNLDKTAKQFGQTGKALTKGLTVPIMAGATALGGLAMKTASYGNELAKTSTKLGINAEQLQDWNYWAEINGLESATLNRALGRLNQRVGRAALGNEKYADAFSGLGVAIHNTDGTVRDSNDVMAETVQKLSEIEDSALRVATAEELFGSKMARDLMPALEAGALSIEEANAKMDEYGRLSNEQAERSEEFMDAIHELKTEFKMLFMELGTDLLPLMQDVFLPLIRDQIIPAIAFFIEKIAGVVEWFSELDPKWQKVILLGLAFLAALGPLLIIIGKIISVVSFMIGVFGKLHTIFLFLQKFVVGKLIPVIAALGAPFLIKLAIIGAVIAIIILLIKNFDKVMAVVRKVGDVFMNVFKKIGSFVTNIIKGIINMYISMINSMLSGISTILNGVFGPVNALIRGANRVPGVNIPQLSVSIPRIPSLDVGTNMVRGDGLAMLHKGEAVVPKKYNPAMGGSGGQLIKLDIALPDIELDGRQVSRHLTPHITRTIKVGGGNV